MSPSQREEMPVREEIVEDEAGVISSVIVPTLAPVEEDAMEESSVGSRTINNSITCSCLCTIIIGRTNFSVFALSWCFLSSLIGEMGDKEREREEN